MKKNKPFGLETFTIYSGCETDKVTNGSKRLARDSRRGPRVTHAGGDLMGVQVQNTDLYTEGHDLYREDMLRKEKQKI